MFPVDHVRAVIETAAPALDTRALRFFAEGWDYELWEVDGLLFRLPKRDECRAPLQVEARLLDAIAPALSLPVPRPEHVGDGFFSYRKLPGLPLAHAALHRGPARAVARRLGAFVGELHRFPVDRAAALGVPVLGPGAWRDGYARFRDEVRAKVLPRLAPSLAANVEAFWNAYLADDRYFQFDPVLLHADLDGAHVLVDPATGDITGVIDFADANAGDPAYDFSGFDPPLREAMLSSYTLPVDSLLRERADIYRYKISPFHAVIYGIETDPTWLEKGLAAVEQAHAQKHTSHRLRR